jgi:hypothetical protein
MFAIFAAISAARGGYVLCRRHIVGDMHRAGRKRSPCSLMQTYAILCSTDRFFPD